MSGEHGDGMVRAEFIPLMLGQEIYQYLKELKYTFDPHCIFNEGKIIDAPNMEQNLRYRPDRVEPHVDTFYDFSDQRGILRIAEKCNGSGDCRKPYGALGVMCPSYRATKDEKDTTRARANALREFLTNSPRDNKFDHRELKEVFDLCLSCKACASECPSNVDISILKSEFLYQYQLKNGFTLRNKLFANSYKFNKWASLMPTLSNFLLNTTLSKKIMGIAVQRPLPKLARQTLWRVYQKKYKTRQGNFKERFVYLFCDEFTNYYEPHIGIDTIELLNALGYGVKILKHQESGRAHISKGFLKQAKKIANTNVNIFKNLISKNTPLVGMEPSSILSFRDEYLRLVDCRTDANKVAKYTFTIEEFIHREFIQNRIGVSHFTSEYKNIKIHGHCHQKSLVGLESIFGMLNIPKNFKVTVITSGCCGMAGSFGYEREHYHMSMQIGKDSIFSKIKNVSKDDIICTSGLSCKHQIQDGTGIEVMHPSSILNQVVIKK